MIVGQTKVRGRVRSSLAGKVDNPVLAARGGPRNLPISFSDDLMCVVEIDEMGLEGTGHRAVPFEHAGRVDVDAEILAAGVAGKRQCVASESTGQLDRIAMRPVECAGDGIFLLYELELQAEMLDRERPDARE